MKNVKFQEVELRGQGEICSSNAIYLYQDTLFTVLNATCKANEYQLIADYLKIDNDGIFQTALYEQNTLKAKKLFLKRLGYKTSNISLKEANDYIVKHFYWTCNN